MRPDSDTWRQWAAGIQAGWLEWLKSPLKDQMPAGAISVCETLSREFYQFQVDMWPTKNLTLTHMDLHIQNIFYDTNNEQDPVVIFDWDGCHLGCGPHDLAYLLSLLPTECRRGHEALLLDEYYNQLMVAGVVNYERADLVVDYRYGCLFSTYLLPVLLDLISDEDEPAAGR